MPEPTTTPLVHNEAEHRFELHVDSHLAYLEYKADEDRFTLTHTEVPAPLKGGRIAERLVDGALLHARTHGLQVVPLCPFALAHVKRHQGWLDVIHPKYRLVATAR